MNSEKEILEYSQNGTSQGFPQRTPGELSDGTTGDSQEELLKESPNKLLEDLQKEFMQDAQ